MHETGLCWRHFAHERLRSHLALVQAKKSGKDEVVAIKKIILAKSKKVGWWRVRARGSQAGRRVCALESQP